jgi:hypothetical protein
MAPKKKQIEEALRELALGHTQLVQIRQNHSDKDDASQIVTNVFDQKIHELEIEITVTAKALVERAEARTRVKQGN